MSYEQVSRTGLDHNHDQVDDPIDNRVDSQVDDQVMEDSTQTSNVDHSSSGASTNTDESTESACPLESIPETDTDTEQLSQTTNIQVLVEKNTSNAFDLFAEEGMISGELFEAIEPLNQTYQTKVINEVKKLIKSTNEQIQSAKNAAIYFAKFHQDHKIECTKELKAKDKIPKQLEIELEKSRMKFYDLEDEFESRVENYNNQFLRWKAEKLNLNEKYKLLVIEKSELENQMDKLQTESRAEMDLKVIENGKLAQEVASIAEQKRADKIRFDEVVLKTRTEFESLARSQEKDKTAYAETLEKLKGLEDVIELQIADKTACNEALLESQKERESLVQSQERNKAAYDGLWEKFKELQDIMDLQKAHQTACEEVLVQKTAELERVQTIATKIDVVAAAATQNLTTAQDYHMNLLHPALDDVKMDLKDLDHRSRSVQEDLTTFTSQIFTKVDELQTAQQKGLQYGSQNSSYLEEMKKLLTEMRDAHSDLQAQLRQSEDNSKVQEQLLKDKDILTMRCAELEVLSPSKWVAISIALTLGQAQIVTLQKVINSTESGSVATEVQMV